MALIPSPIEKVEDPLFDRHGVEVFVKRDDLIHPLVMGNKWRKLNYNIVFAKAHQYSGILTVGGAFSNHIAATAAACEEHGLKSIGIIRGDELNSRSNATLRFSSGRGMQLKFVSREAFKTIRHDHESLQKDYPDYYCLPEGGTNPLAIKGCEEIVEELDVPFDYLVTPVGTGGTMAGMLKGLNGEKKLLGFSVLKGDFVRDDFRRLLQEHDIHHTNYEISTSFHFGGYGKVSDELIDFINSTGRTYNLPLDPVYTGKMYFGLKSMIGSRVFDQGIRIIVVHTGGLQGIEGYNEYNQVKISL